MLVNLSLLVLVPVGVGMTVVASPSALDLLFRTVTESRSQTAQERRMFFRLLGSQVMQPDTVAGVLQILDETWPQGEIRRPVIIVALAPGLHPAPRLDLLPWDTLPQTREPMVSALTASSAGGFALLASLPDEALQTAERRAVQLADRLTIETLSLLGTDMSALTQVAAAAGQGVAGVLADDPARAAALLARVGPVIAARAEQPADSFRNALIQGYLQEVEAIGGEATFDLPVVPAPPILPADPPADPVRPVFPSDPPASPG